MTHTDDMLRLIRAIADNPDEDTPRLMLADALDEQGENARAEMIRVSVELSRLPPKHRELFVMDGAGTMLEGLSVGLRSEGDGYCSVSYAESGLSIETFTPGERVDVYKGKDWLRGLKYVKNLESKRRHVFRKDEHSGAWKGTQLLARQAELLALHETDWRRGIKCQECDDDTHTDCPNCWLTGDAGGLLRKFTYSESDFTGLSEPVRVEWRGYWPETVLVPRLSDLVEEYEIECPYCAEAPIMVDWETGVMECGRRGCENGATGCRPTTWAASLFHPDNPPERSLLRRLVPLDREPMIGNGSQVGFIWLSPSSSSSPSHPQCIIPEPIFALLQIRKGAAARYPTRQLAIDALGEAMAEFCRGKK